MTERAQRIVDATMELTLRPQKGDRAKVIAAALRAVAEELPYIQYAEWEIVKETMEDINKLADELETLDELAQENSQSPLDAL